MDEVRPKLDSVHKSLRKQACLVEDANAVDIEGRAGRRRCELHWWNWISEVREVMGREVISTRVCIPETLQQQLQQQHEL